MLRYCVCCAELLAIQQNGRPRKTCLNCKASYRKAQKHKQYLRKIKFPTLNNAEIEGKLNDLREAIQNKKDKEAFRTEFHYIQRHMHGCGLKPENLLGHPINDKYVSLLLDEKNHVSPSIRG